MYTGVIKLLQHKMDEATKNIFKNELEYLINFDIEQATVINNFKQTVNNQISDSNEKEYMLEKFETNFKDVTRLAQIILHAFDNINFDYVDLIHAVLNFNCFIQMFQSHFNAINLEYV